MHPVKPVNPVYPVIPVRPVYPVGDATMGPIYFHKLIATVVGGVGANDVNTPASTSKFHGFAIRDLLVGIAPLIDTPNLYDPAISYVG